MQRVARRSGRRAAHRAAASTPNVAIGDASSNAAGTGCLAFYNGGKPVDQAKLHDVDTSTASAPEKGFARGRIYFAAEQWVDAAIAFRTVAFADPDTDVGVYASQLYLESLNVLRMHSRRDCEDDMASDVPRLHDLYCAGRRAKNAEHCAILDRIDVDIRRLRAQRLVERGDRDSDPDAYRRGADAYLAILRTKCLPESNFATHCDELAYNAGAAFLAAGAADAASAFACSWSTHKTNEHEPARQKAFVSHRRTAERRVSLSVQVARVARVDRCTVVSQMERHRKTPEPGP